LWIIKCSLAVGIILALASCVGEGGYEGDPRSFEDRLTQGAMDSEQIDAGATDEAQLDDILSSQATRNAELEESWDVTRAAGGTALSLTVESEAPPEQ
jgi:hypothetical protein